VLARVEEVRGAGERAFATYVLHVSSWGCIGALAALGSYYGVSMRFHGTVALCVGLSKVPWSGAAEASMAISVQLSRIPQVAMVRACYESYMSSTGGGRAAGGAHTHSASMAEAQKCWCSQLSMANPHARPAKVFHSIQSLFESFLGFIGGSQAQGHCSQKGSMPGLVHCPTR
jgi:hypothetical protein